MESEVDGWCLCVCVCVYVARVRYDSYVVFWFSYVYVVSYLYRCFDANV